MVVYRGDGRGRTMITLLFAIVTWLFGLLILYLVIYFAVKDAINKSVIGQHIQEKYGIKKEMKPFLGNDLDQDN